MFVKNTLLPIGSIISVKGVELMICAYFKENVTINNQKYDYACCIYPDGLGKNAIIVKKEEVQKVIFIGYHNAKFNALKEKMGY